MIEGRIVRIVDERTLIADIGTEQGVTVGQQFVVIQPMDAVVDPDTNETLGVWEMVKARLVAMHAQPRITTLVPLPSAESQPTVLSQRMAWDSHGAPIGSSEVTLAVDRSQMSGRRRAEVIKVGDPVRSVE